MKLRKLSKTDSRTEARLRLIVTLGRRRDQILQSPVLNLEALASLADEYESAGLPRAASALRKRLGLFRNPP